MGATDDGLRYLVDLKELRQLILGKTLVTDAGLVRFQLLPQLKDLRLDGTSVTNDGLVHLEGLTQLKELHLKNTNVSAAGVEGLKKNIPACQIFTEPPGATDLERLQGTWVEATCEWKGENVVFGQQCLKWTRTILGNRSFGRNENGVAIDAFTFRLVPGQTPKAVDSGRPRPGRGPKARGYLSIGGGHFQDVLDRGGPGVPDRIHDEAGHGDLLPDLETSP